jgi:hypothetical protein
MIQQVTCRGITSSLLFNRVGAGYFAALPPPSFSEKSPACYRPVFDGIGEMWFAATVVKKRSVMGDGGTGGLLGASSIFNSEHKSQRSGTASVIPSGLEFCYSGTGKGKNYGTENEFKKRRH